MSFTLGGIQIPEKCKESNRWKTEQLLPGKNVEIVENVSALEVSLHDITLPLLLPDFSNTLQELPLLPA